MAYDQSNISLVQYGWAWLLNWICCGWRATYPYSFRTLAICQIWHI